ncbi:uncharacterized protein [Heptranchias perlo]|uniref:uncharacterized protein n=1 Tax=Heptranchias perlo TaxID=212740 RepID=UPI0035597B6F
MGLVERTLCLGVLRIATNLACSKESVFTQSVSGQTIVLLLFTDVCVTGYLFICWFADLQLVNGQEVTALRFIAFVNETYNAVTFLIPGLIAAETHFAARLQRTRAPDNCGAFSRTAPAAHLLPLVNGVYTLLCWTISASYGAHYYRDDVHFVRQCSGGHPPDQLHCFRGFHLPDPFLAIAELLITASYVFYRGKRTDSYKAHRRASITTQLVSSAPPLSEAAPDAPLKGCDIQTTPSPQTPATQPGYLLTGLVAMLMLYPGLPYLGLTSPLIGAFEQLCHGFFVRLSKYPQHDIEHGTHTASPKRADLLSTEHQ